jgi:hypothetical protein
MDLYPLYHDSEKGIWRKECTPEIVVNITEISANTLYYRQPKHFGLTHSDIKAMKELIAEDGSTVKKKDPLSHMDEARKKMVYTFYYYIYKKATLIYRKHLGELLRIEAYHFGATKKEERSLNNTILIHKFLYLRSMEIKDKVNNPKRVLGFQVNGSSIEAIEVVNTILSMFESRSDRANELSARYNKKCEKKNNKLLEKQTDEEQNNIFSTVGAEKRIKKA